MLVKKRINVNEDRDVPERLHSLVLDLLIRNNVPHKVIYQVHGLASRKVVYVNRL